MIHKKTLQKNLEELDALYNHASTNTSMRVLYSKLALLEYCGWIEENFDLIVKRSLKTKIKHDKNLTIVENFIKNTYGFEYEKHFKKMLIQAIGIVAVDRFETFLNRQGDLDTLKGELGVIKGTRNQAAHTSAQTTQSYSAPSAILESLKKLYPIIKKIYSYFVKYKHSV